MTKEKKFAEKKHCLEAFMSRGDISKWLCGDNKNYGQLFIQTKLNTSFCTPVQIKATCTDVLRQSKRNQRHL